jgi:membrane protease YdiL (CAAX protease family)
LENKVVSEMTVKNSVDEIQKRIDLGQINRTLTFLAVLVRPALFIGVQGLMVILFIALKYETPALAVTSWWTVYGTLVDFGCLLSIFLLLRKERIRISDLLSFDKSKIGWDLLIGIGIIIIVFPLAVFTGYLIGSSSVYGSLHPVLPPGNPMTRTLPVWAAVYSKMFWWIISASTEEIIYQGYALPRLQVFFGRKWPAVLWVGFGWALQHSFLPFINLKYAIYAFLLFFPLTIALQLIYLRVKRLFPLIIGHWGMDCISAIFMISGS